MITIDKIAFNFIAQNESFVFGCYEKWEEFYYQKIVCVIDEVLLLMDERGRSKTIANIELNITPIPEEYFFELFPIRLKAELEKAISLIKKTAKGENAYRLDEHLVSNIEHYLAIGLCNSEQEENAFCLQTEIEYLLRIKNSKAAKLIQYCFYNENPALFKRLMMYLDNATLTKILSEWLQCESITKEERESAMLLFIHTHTAVFLQLLKRIKELSSDTFTLLNETIVSSIKYLILEKNKYENVLLTLFENQSLLAFPVLQVLQNFRLNIPNGKVSEILQSKNKPEISVTIERIPESLFVYNAGLVLLTPWLPRLFTTLELLDKEKKDFRNMESRIKAIFIIQHLVTGEDKEYKEQELAFNRVLVSCPFSEVLPNHVELTNEEIEAVDSMLEGVKGNWSLMAATSVKGFQHSFVERKGVLEMQEERMLLTVEPRSYDLLLDSLPWGYKLVRFPWLEKRIHVNWRDKEL